MSTNKLVSFASLRRIFVGHAVRGHLSFAFRPVNDGMLCLLETLRVDGGREKMPKKISDLCAD